MSRTRSRVFERPELWPRGARLRRCHVEAAVRGGFGREDEEVGERAEAVGIERGGAV